jgi:hypothetical protein
MRYTLPLIFTVIAYFGRVITVKALHLTRQQLPCHTVLFRLSTEQLIQYSHKDEEK